MVNSNYYECDVLGTQSVYQQLLFLNHAVSYFLLHLRFERSTLVCLAAPSVGH